MLGNFARLVRGPPRLLRPDEVATTPDSPPERFTEKISDEGGDVYVSPMLETLRAVLAKARRPAGDASAAAPEEATPHPRTERP